MHYYDYNEPRQHGTINFQMCIRDRLWKDMVIFRRLAVSRQVLVALHLPDDGEQMNFPLFGIVIQGLSLIHISLLIIGF